MKDIKTVTPLVVERIYDADVNKVWRAITNKDQMKEWYFDLSAFQPEVGFEFQFKGQGPRGETFVHRCRILEVIPLKKLRYSWQYAGFPGYSVVTFELFDEGEKTRLKLSHEGLESFPQDQGDFATKNFSEGWTYLLGKSLPEFLGK
jgi:uncharacterized protein YndB with AHSA1/START domain